jgi:multidrug efflux pump subunit AcrA (membrane-fusion protein)
VIELVDRRTLSPADRSTCLQLLAAVAEVVNDYHRNRELAQLRQQQRQRSEYERFSLRVHRSLDVAQTAYLIANEGRAIVGCDRLGVLTFSGRSCKAIAISGVDSLDRRSKLVRTLERLVARVLPGGEPLWHCDGAADMPDEIERPLQAYLDESHARVLAVVPLHEPRPESEDTTPRVIGALVAEQFQSSARDPEFREGLTAVAGHGGTAMANALAHEHFPLARIGRMLARARWLTEARQLPKTIAAATIIAAVVGALVLIPADFDIEARGEFQPLVRRDVFASDNGVVSELLVEHGRAVKADEPLLVLRKPELDLELRRVAGEIQTVERKLAAVQAERLARERTNTDRQRETHQLTADEEELKELLRGLGDQHAILKLQREALITRSPIDGQALTWKLTELLATRPVERGQSLLTVADVDGPWVVELRVPDDRAGHVLTARDELKPDLDVSFAPSSDPGREYQGRIGEVAMSTEVDETAGPTVLVTVEFDRQNVTALRPGATALAKIHCGRRSLGYVWLHELFEFIQTHLRW